MLTRKVTTIRTITILPAKKRDRKNMGIMAQPISIRPRKESSISSLQMAKKKKEEKPKSIVKMMKEAEKKYAYDQVYGDIGKASYLSKEKNRG